MPHAAEGMGKESTRQGPKAVSSTNSRNPVKAKKRTRKLFELAPEGKIGAKTFDTGTGSHAKAAVEGSSTRDFVSTGNIPRPADSLNHFSLLEGASVEELSNQRHSEVTILPRLEASPSFDLGNLSSLTSIEEHLVKSANMMIAQSPRPCIDPDILKRVNEQVKSLEKASQDPTFSDSPIQEIRDTVPQPTPTQQPNASSTQGKENSRARNGSLSDWSIREAAIATAVSSDVNSSADLHMQVPEECLPTSSQDSLEDAQKDAVEIVTQETHEAEAEPEVSNTPSRRANDLTLETDPSTNPAQNGAQSAGLSTGMRKMQLAQDTRLPASASQAAIIGRPEDFFADLSTPIDDTASALEAIASLASSSAVESVGSDPLKFGMAQASASHVHSASSSKDSNDALLSLPEVVPTTIKGDQKRGLDMDSIPSSRNRKHQRPPSPAYGRKQRIVSTVDTTISNENEASTETSLPRSGRRKGETPVHMAWRISEIMRTLTEFAHALLKPAPDIPDEEEQCNSSLCVRNAAKKGRRCNCANCVAFREGLYSSSDLENSVSCKNGYIPSDFDAQCECISCQCFREGLALASEERILPGLVMTFILGSAMTAAFDTKPMDPQFKSVACVITRYLNEAYPFDQFLEKAAELKRIVDESDGIAWFDWMAYTSSIKNGKEIKSQQHRLIVSVPSVVFESGESHRGYTAVFDRTFLKQQGNVDLTPLSLKNLQTLPSYTGNMAASQQAKCRRRIERLLKTLDEKHNALVKYDTAIPNEDVQSTSRLCRSKRTAGRCRCSRCAAFREGLYYTIALKNSVNCRFGYVPGNENPNCTCDTCQSFREGQSLAPPQYVMPSPVTVYLLAIGMSEVFNHARISKRSTGSGTSKEFPVKDPYGNPNARPFNERFQLCVSIVCGYFTDEIAAFCMNARELDRAVRMLPEGEGRFDWSFSYGGPEDGKVIGRKDGTKTVFWNVMTVPNVILRQQDETSSTGFSEKLLKGCQVQIMEQE